MKNQKMLGTVILIIYYEISEDGILWICFWWQCLWMVVRNPVWLVSRDSMQTWRSEYVYGHYCVGPVPGASGKELLLPHLGVGAWALCPSLTSTLLLQFLGGLGSVNPLTITLISLSFSFLIGPRFPVHHRTNEEWA